MISFKCLIFSFLFISFNVFSSSVCDGDIPNNLKTKKVTKEKSNNQKKRHSHDKLFENLNSFKIPKGKIECDVSDKSDCKKNKN